MSIILKFGAPPTTYPEKKREYTTHKNITPFPTAVVKKLLSQKAIKVQRWQIITRVSKPFNEFIDGNWFLSLIQWSIHEMKIQYLTSALLKNYWMLTGSMKKAVPVLSSTYSFHRLPWDELSRYMCYGRKHSSKTPMMVDNFACYLSILLHIFHLH